MRTVHLTPKVTLSQHWSTCFDVRGVQASFSILCYGHEPHLSRVGRSIYVLEEAGPQVLPLHRQMAILS